MAVFTVNTADKHKSPYASPSAFAGHYGICSSDVIGDLSDEDYWLEDWALFATITEHYSGKIDSVAGRITQS